MSTRSTLTAALAVALAAVLLTTSCVAGGEEAPTTSDKAEKAEKAETKAEMAKPKEEKAPVMATLTYFEDVGGRKGGKQTREVEYLPEGKKIATMETSKGVVKIELWEDKAPNTVINFVHLANSGRYDGVDFHRVLDGFMAQTGDVEKKKGYGGPGYTIPGEMSKVLKHERGVVSMARGPDKDSGGSQFFIMFAANAGLDGEYAAFGKVIEGMGVIDSLKKGDRQQNGAVTNPDTITKLRVVSVPSGKTDTEQAEGK